MMIAAVISGLVLFYTAYVLVDRVDRQLTEIKTHVKHIDDVINQQITPDESVEKQMNARVVELQSARFSPSMRSMGKNKKIQTN